MRHVTSTHYFSGLLQDWFHVFLYEIKKNSVWYNFYHGTSVSITFYIFEHYQLWMMDSKGQRVFFPKTPQLCVWHTEVRRCYHFKLVSHFQLWFPIWGVLVNRLNIFQSVESKQSWSASDDPSGHTCICLCIGLMTLTSGLYAGISMTVMWSKAPRWGRGRALYAPLWVV